MASATALVCSQAVWAGLLGRVLGERLPKRAWAGTAVCLAGVLLITGVDVSLSARALGGDALALLGGIFGGAYIVTGGFVRRELSTVTYTLLCYGACALLLLAVCVASGQSLGGYAADDWVRIAALTVIGQLLGHTLLNLVLRSISPTIASLATLFTVPRSRDHRRADAGGDPAGGGGPGARAAARRDRPRDQCARATSGGGDLSIRAVASAASSTMQIAEPTHQMQMASSSNTST